MLRKKQHKIIEEREREYRGGNREKVTEKEIKTCEGREMITEKKREIERERVLKRK